MGVKPAVRAAATRVAAASAPSLLVLFVSACCLGGGTTWVTHRLDPYGISIDLAAGETGGPAGAGYLFTSGDGSSTVTVTPGAPGGPAATRMTSEFLPGATTVIEWTRPCVFGDMTGTETRLVESFPQTRVHWVGAVDAPAGVVFIDLATEQRWVSGPTGGDLGWTTLRGSVRRTP